MERFPIGPPPTVDLTAHFISEECSTGDRAFRCPRLLVNLTHNVDSEATNPLIHMQGINTQWVMLGPSSESVSGI